MDHVGQSLNVLLPCFFLFFSGMLTAASKVLLSQRREHWTTNIFTSSRSISHQPILGLLW
jgi:hypothetical protein